ncbi:MAG: helix-turn-helix transcriptional regulator [Oscillospiraceae bacterium]|nr:helix-turn-helix transcriptional regulator [Oscillospiraceae bacterium]
MSLGENIYRLRSEKGMSQSELAEALNVSRQSISKWETDGSVPELDKLLSLSDLFGVSLDELVKGSAESEFDADTEYDDETEEAQTSSSGLYSLILSDMIYDRESMARFLCESLNYTEAKAWEAIMYAPTVIVSGKYYDVAKRYSEGLSEIAATKILSDEDAQDPDKIKRAPGALPPVRRSPTMATSEEDEDKSEGMSFGGTVAAVVVGVVIAILLLSIF